MSKMNFDSNIVGERLLLSYSGDQPPFNKDCKKPFPRREPPLEIIGCLREIFFPNYWNCVGLNGNKGQAAVSKRLEKLSSLLIEDLKSYCSSEEQAVEVAGTVLNSLPDIREMLKLDVEAAYVGDPSARSYVEIIRSYPGFNAMLVQRVAHVIYGLGVYSYARELMEAVHSMNAIDIHPGARVGSHFFIDHGSGVVIGETAEIGDWVRIYQSVTLGALNFEMEEGKRLRKGYKRHPSIGSHVVIGAGAKILGPVTIGDYVSIGANSWIQEDIPDNMTVYITEHPKLHKMDRKKQN